jgi:CTP:molybdopterin cytidylyltransferase MocA
MHGVTLAAVVLAAGGSTRLGTPKQLVAYEGEPLVRRAARAARDAGAALVVVVLGASAEIIAPALDGLTGVTTIVNDAWATGLASSLAAGLRTTVDAGADAILVTLADQPLVDVTALETLIAAYPGPHHVVAASYDDVLGVPAIFGREHVDALLSLVGDAGAGAWLRRNRHLVVAVPLAAARVDVDTIEDVERLRGEHQIEPADQSADGTSR